jgi:hypothetical protein
MIMDDYADHFQLDSLGIVSGDTNAWTPSRRNWDNWSNWVSPIPKNGWNETPQSPTKHAYDKEKVCKALTILYRKHS